MRTSALMLSLILICPCSWADSPWVLNQAASQNGVTVYSRDEADGLRAFKGEVVVDAPIKTVLPLVLAKKLLPLWWYNLKVASPIASKQNEDGLVYLWCKGPWPVSDRDVVARVTIEQDPTSKEISLRYADTDPSLAPRHPDRVRLKKMSSLFRLMPLPNGKTKLELSGRADPGGGIPVWVANQFALDTPKHSLSRLRELAEHPETVDLGLFKEDADATAQMTKLQLPEQLKPSSN